MTSFQLNEQTKAFLSAYQLFQDDPTQQVQLQHRIELVNAFGIHEGMRVLEIGCGQGDTTSAIADLVGETGHVVAIDIASPDYGAPLTLGQATDQLKQSALGERITFHLETDFNQFETDISFDIAVLSHCSWYFKNPKDLLHYFKKLRTMAKCIAFAEWDVDFTNINQRSHFCATSILALYSTFVINDGNVQNVFHKSHIQQLFEEAGFTIEHSSTVDATYLQDGKWEKNYANSLRSEFMKAPLMIQTLVNSYYELMNASNGDESTLNSFVLLAT